MGLATHPTLPDAYRAAARLGCQETFALVSDERSQGTRRVWLAEQVELSRYDMRELLGEDWTGRETDDRFAFLYMQAAKHNVHWLVISPGAPDGPYEIRDQYGRTVVKKLLRMRDAYTKGPALTQAAFCAKHVGDVVWVEVWGDNGKMIAEAPARVQTRDVETDANTGAVERVIATFNGGDNETAFEDAAKKLAAGLASMGAPMHAAQAVAAAATAKASEMLTFVWEGDPAKATGSACENEDGSLKLFMALDTRVEKDDAEDEDDDEDGDEGAGEAGTSVGEADEGDGGGVQ